MCGSSSPTRIFDPIAATIVESAHGRNHGVFVVGDGAAPTIANSSLGLSAGERQIGVDGGARSLRVRIPGRIHPREPGPVGWQLVSREDGLVRAGLDAGAAVDAVVWVDIELAIDAHISGDAIDREDGHARLAHVVDARVAGYVGHGKPPQ